MSLCAAKAHHKCISRLDAVTAVALEQAGCCGHGLCLCDGGVQWCSGRLSVVAFCCKHRVSDAEARNSAFADSIPWQRKGVPLHIVKSRGPMERTLTDLVALAKVLYQEEQKAFHAAMEDDTDR